MKTLFVDVPLRLRSNFILFYWDIAVWGLYTGSTVVFINVYAAREGATNEQIGWMTAGPALVALLTSIPLGLWARRYPFQRSVVLSAIIGRTLLLGYVFVPLLVDPPARIAVLLILTTVMALPNTLLSICFGPFFMEGIPPEWRGTVVGVRNALMSVISFFVTLLCGQLLVHLDFPLGYQVVFLVGFLGAIATVAVLVQVKQFGPMPTATSPLPVKSSNGVLGKLIPSKDPAGRHYMVVVGMLFALNAAAFMAAPLIPQFTVNHLGLDDGVISIGSAASSMLVFGVSLFVGRMTRRFGNRVLTAIGVALLCFQTILLASAQGAGLFIAASLVGGFASGILMAAQFNYHLENIPRLDQTVWISWNSMLGSVAAVLGSVAGPALADAMGIPATFILLGVFRLLIGVAIYFWG